MERSFYNEDFDFEQLIKQKSDQYKIYPSEKVWKGIHGSLHSSRRWYWLGFLLVLSGVGYYTADLITDTKPHSRSSASLNQQDDPSATPAPTAPDNNTAIILPFTPPQVSPLPRPATGFSRKGLVIDMHELTGDPNTNSQLLPNEIAAAGSFAQLETIIAAEPENPSALTAVTLSGYSEQLLTVASIPPHQSLLKETETPGVLTGLTDKTLDRPILPGMAASETKADEKRINWLQENAVYELTRPKTKRVGWQLTLSPTMNYRKLKNNRNASAESDVKTIPVSLDIRGDVENLVKHKPALGFEFGSMFLYAVNKNITFKTGFQFNYSRYDIQAYGAATADRATIALNNFYGARTDSITTYSSLRTFGGTSVQELQNEYYQLSVPVGVEMLLIGRGKLQLAVAGTLQPTYLINRDNYLITTDYKNYTREPSLVRRWNVNAGAEAYVSYKIAGLKFQVGPQLRYQLFSTYDEKYPIREFLTEYGVKFGISKTIR